MYTFDVLGIFIKVSYDIFFCSIGRICYDYLYYFDSKSKLIHLFLYNLSHVIYNIS